jgi:hypothetical protein
MWMKVVDKVMDESYLPLSSNICAFFIILNMENMDEKLDDTNVWDENMDDDGDLDGNCG